MYWASLFISLGLRVEYVSQVCYCTAEHAHYIYEEQHIT